MNTCKILNAKTVDIYDLNGSGLASGDPAVRIAVKVLGNVASEYGIKSYKSLKATLNASKGKGSGLEVHHLIEKRFANLLGVKEDDMLSIVVTHDEHVKFTKAWRNEIGYNIEKKTKETVTSNASINDIKRTIRKVYKDYPEIITFFENIGF